MPLALLGCLANLTLTVGDDEVPSIVHQGPKLKEGDADIVAVYFGYGVPNVLVWARQVKRSQVAQRD